MVSKKLYLNLHKNLQENELKNGLKEKMDLKRKWT